MLYGIAELTPGLYVQTMKLTQWSIKHFFTPEFTALDIEGKEIVILKKCPQSRLVRLEQ